MEDCPICYESVNASTGHCTLACSHSFHISCLTRWSSTNASCPMCRNAMGATEAPVRAPVADGNLRVHQILDMMVNAGLTGPRNIVDMVGMELPNPTTNVDTTLINEEPLPNPQVNIRDDVGGDLVVEERDITLVMAQAEATRGEAVRALRRYEGDIVNSIMMLTSPPLPLVTQRRRRVRQRDPMTEPSDDQVAAWSLQRLFGDESTHYNTHSDLLGRMNYTLRRNKFWQHEEHNDIDDHPGYESA